MELGFPDQDVKVNCWGAVSAEDATSLEIFEDNLKVSAYQTILERHIPEMDCYILTSSFLFTKTVQFIKQLKVGWEITIFHISIVMVRSVILNKDKFIIRIIGILESIEEVGL